MNNSRSSRLFQSNNNLLLWYTHKLSNIHIYIHRKMSPILTPIWSSCVIDWWKWETSNGMTMRSKIDVYVASRERIGHPAECIYRKPFEGNRNGKERWRRHEGLSSHWSSMIYWVISLRYLFFIDENLSFVPYARMCLWKCDYRSIEYCSRDDKKHHQICWMTSCEQNISSDKLRWRISIFFDDWVQNEDVKIELLYKKLSQNEVYNFKILHLDKKYYHLNFQFA